eukprot:c8258_g1_i1.p1 GENE.c8258_g1_i1~~c8258_g1_i1.p1  ORF type:complete len:285 (-),score=51.31 c8258_g1_i1:92-946(-)
MQPEGDRQLHRDSQKRVTSQIGFRGCLDLLSASRVPIVGHNMFLDMLHTYDKFFQPLPQDLASFRAAWTSKFHTTIDTKYIIHSSLPYFSGLPNTALPAVFDYFCRNNSTVKVELASGFERYLQEETEHEAAYDAYVTGNVLVNVAHFLKMRFSSSMTTISETQLTTPNAMRVKVGDLNASVINKVYLMRMQNGLDLMEHTLTGDQINAFISPQMKRAFEFSSSPTHKVMSRPSNGVGSVLQPAEPAVVPTHTVVPKRSFHVLPAAGLGARTGLIARALRKTIV